MSTYSYLLCLDCKESIYAKDAGRPVHADPEQLGKFLEKHHAHSLTIRDEDDVIYFKWDGRPVFASSFPEFKP